MDDPGRDPGVDIVRAHKADGVAGDGGGVVHTADGDVDRFGGRSVKAGDDEAFGRFATCRQRPQRGAVMGERVGPCARAGIEIERAEVTAQRRRVGACEAIFAGIGIGDPHHAGGACAPARNDGPGPVARDFGRGVPALDSNDDRGGCSAIHAFDHKRVGANLAVNQGLDRRTVIVERIAPTACCGVEAEAPIGAVKHPVAQRGEGGLACVGIVDDQLATRHGAVRLPFGDNAQHVARDRRCVVHARDRDADRRGRGSVKAGDRQAIGAALPMRQRARGGTGGGIAPIARGALEREHAVSPGQRDRVRRGEHLFVPIRIEDAQPA